MYGWISFCRVYWIAFTSQSSGMQTRGTSPSKKARNHSSEVRINGGYLSHVSQTLGCLIACTVNCSRKETRQARSTRWPWKSTAVFSLKCKFHYHTWRHFQRYVSRVIWSSHAKSVSLNSFILSRVKILHLLASDRCYVTPQSGRVGVGDTIYRYMSSGDQFSPEHLLNFLSLSSEHDALEIADRVEAAMYVWRRKASATHVVSKWENVTELNADGDKNLVLASRARSLLLCLKQRFPGLSQTTLDTSKIQYNKVMANIKQERKNSDYSMFICIFLVTRKRSWRNIYTHTHTGWCLCKKN